MRRRRVAVPRCRFPDRDVDGRVVGALLLLLQALWRRSSVEPLRRRRSSWRTLRPAECRAQNLDAKVDLLCLLGLRGRRASGTAGRPLGQLSRWALLLLSRRHLLLLLLLGTQLLAWRGLWPGLRLALPQTNLDLTLDLHLALHLHLTLRLWSRTLHLRRCGLHMVEMRPLLLLLLLLYGRFLLPLLWRWRLLPLRLSRTRPRGVKDPAPYIGTRSTAHTEGLGDDSTANRKTYLLDRVLLEKVGCLVEPAVLTACRCLGGGGGRCLDILLLLMLDYLSIRLHSQRCREIDLLLVLVDDLAVLLRVDGCLWARRGLIWNWWSLLLSVMVSLLLQY